MTNKAIRLGLIMVLWLASLVQLQAQTPISEQVSEWLSTQGYKFETKVDSDGDTWYTFRSQARMVYVLLYTDRPHQMRVGMALKLDPQVPIAAKLLAANVTMNRYVDIRIFLDEEDDAIFQVDNYLDESPKVDDFLEYALSILGSADDKYIEAYQELRTQFPETQSSEGTPTAEH